MTATRAVDSSPRFVAPLKLAVGFITTLRGPTQTCGGGHHHASRPHSGWRWGSSFQGNSSFIIHHSSFRGFTLVEALVALSITALVAVSVIGSVGAMMASSTRNAEETTLTFLARAVAADIRLRGLPAERSGNFDSHPDFRWHIETTSFRDPAGAPVDAPTLKEVLITVTAPNGRTGALRTLVR